MGRRNVTATRPVRVAVCGGGSWEADACALAEDVGSRLAVAGAVLICGGLGGVMSAAAKGAALAGGLTIGVLPGADAAAANEHIALPLPTGMGEGRNVLVVRFADAVIAIGGEWGTLSEIALARKIGVPVVALASPLAATIGIANAPDARAAVRAALAAAVARRTGTPLPPYEP
jgi:uncharacterized protein (TIGR00725 family)